MKIEYSSNNSGGNYWLKKSNWVALEKAGWTIQWGGVYFCKTEFERLFEKPPEAPTYNCPDGKCNGHRKFTSLFDYEKADKKYKFQFSNTPCARASIEAETPGEAMRLFEKITRQKVTDEGCNCCGAPHSFSWVDSEGKYQFASGESCLEYLYPNKRIPKNLREAIENQ